jgi:2,4-dienoyl-CoA reductase-like NADH-dependent reductase (Old Yellow Enzyme family)
VPAQGYVDTPGLFTAEQIRGWQDVTRAVHERGGKIVVQIWHTGRMSHVSFQPNGQAPGAPSAIRAKAKVFVAGEGFTDTSMPRALLIDELPQIIDDFRLTCGRALEAGFDGVEIHGANGYLVDQFLQSGTNHRTDEYGGPVENRARFMLAVADAAISVWGPQRVGMHLAPRGDSFGISDANHAETFGYAATELGKRGIAFICAREYFGVDRLGPKLKKAFGGVYIANEQYTRETANRVLASGEADAVAFGQLFIANPDLPKRFATGVPLNQPNPATYYAEGAEGYTDYPAWG